MRTKLAPLWAALVLLLVPWTSWLTLGTHDAVLAIRAVPYLMFGTGATLAVALYIAQTDHWLGAWLAWEALRSALPSNTWQAQTLSWVLLGAFTLTMVRRLPERYRLWLRWALVASGVLQLFDVIEQAWGYDVLVTGWGWHPPGLLVGTLGNSTFVGTFLAVTGALAPVWLLPIFVGGLILVHAKIGMVALVAGVLAVQGRRWAWLAGGAVVLAVAGVGAVALGAANSVEWTDRLDIADRAMRTLTRWQLVVGTGLGGWFATIPALQLTHPTMSLASTSAGDLYLTPTATPGIFDRAGSDVLQFTFECGAVGWLFLTGWLTRWLEPMWRSPYRGAVVAGALCCIPQFPWHVPGTATVLLAVVGLSTADAA